MEFEWDKAKAAANFKKHKVTFDEACTVFSDPLARIFDDEGHSTEERRELIIGHSIINRLLLVCFTEADADWIRIFSARQVTKNERKEYEENQNS
ncbi:MAG: BrnT family toxin [Acidobacteria bacterium]|nr:BrnT family toxin [Acidobacteriota bacterium]